MLALADALFAFTTSFPPALTVIGDVWLLAAAQAEDGNTAVLWALMPWYGNANSTVTAGRMVAYGANWVNEIGPNLIKLWDSADWGINYMHAKLNVLTPFNNRLFVPSYDGRILVMG